MINLFDYMMIEYQNTKFGHAMQPMNENPVIDLDGMDPLNKLESKI